MLFRSEISYRGDESSPAKNLPRCSAGIDRSASQRNRQSPLASLIPRRTADPLPPCSALITRTRGSTCPIPLTMLAVSSLEPSSTTSSSHRRSAGSQPFRNSTRELTVVAIRACSLKAGITTLRYGFSNGYFVVVYSGSGPHRSKKFTPSSRVRKHRAMPGLPFEADLSR